MDPEFKKEYEALQPEMDIKRAILDARINAGLTQSELSEKSGISQADISRLEKGTRNPSIALLKRLADALDSTLRIEFVPKKVELENRESICEPLSKLIFISFEMIGSLNSMDLSHCPFACSSS